MSGLFTLRTSVVQMLEDLEDVLTGRTVGQATTARLSCSHGLIKGPPIVSRNSACAYFLMPERSCPIGEGRDWGGAGNFLVPIGIRTIRGRCFRLIEKNTCIGTVSPNQCLEVYLRFWIVLTRHELLSILWICHGP